MDRWRSVSVLAAVVLAAACGGEPEPEAASPGADVAVSHRAAKVRWESDWEAAFDRARSEGRPVLVNFSADWCVWCARLDTTTMRDGKVAELMSTRVVPLKLDVDREGRDAAARFGVDGLPTLVLIDAEGVELGRVSGYVSPGVFLETVGALLPPVTPS